MLCFQGAGTTAWAGLIPGQAKDQAEPASSMGCFWEKGVQRGLCIPDGWRGHEGLSEHLWVGCLSCYHGNRSSWLVTIIPIHQCSLIFSKIFCTKMLDFTEGTFWMKWLLLLFSLQSRSAVRVSLKIWRSDQTNLLFKTTKQLSPACGTTSKLPVWYL